MTEVSVSPNRGKALFATKEYKKGSLLLEEEPIFAPLTEKELEVLWEDGKESSTGDGSKDWESNGNLRGMITAGFCWIQRVPSMADSDKELLMDLYHPSKESASGYEKPVFEVVGKALQHLQQVCDKKKIEVDWKSLEAVLLIWACNSFEGGRIYPQISRINHDCNPNAIVKADGETQRILAVTDIAVGDEITISYLGLHLYTETSVRRERLLATKYFFCQCPRCMNKDDIAGYIPCPRRHPREFPQQSLDEDTQYDDNQTVDYISPGNNTKAMGGDKKLQIVMQNVTSKVLNYMDSIKGGTKKGGDKQQDDEDDDDDDDDDDDNAVLEDCLGLATTIMGDKHWTTNILKLIYLDQKLTQMSQMMLTVQQNPDLEDVAEVVDSLQRVERFVTSLQLQLHPGHILGDVIIGLSRTLVSLGDLKSQKYGAQWVEKITDYVTNFESEGKQKVVNALRMAWKQHDDSNDGDEKGRPVTKKLKSSSS